MNRSRRPTPVPAARWVAGAAAVALAALALAAPVRAAEPPPVPEDEQVGAPPPRLADADRLAFSVPKVVFLAAFAAGVLWAANWSFRDARLVNTNLALWNAVVLGAGAAGLAAAVLVPVFLIGLPLGIIVAAGGLVAYAMHRNTLVPEKLRVLTGDHLRRVLRRVRGQAPDEGESRGPVIGVGRDIIFMGLDDLAIRLEPAGDVERRALDIAEGLLFGAIIRQATMFGYVVQGGKAQARMRIEGKVADAGEVDPALAPGGAAMLKRLAGLDPAETRKPQEGRLKAVVAGQPFELRVKSSGSVRGEQIAIRIIDVEASKKRLEELGLSDPQLALLRDALSRRPGMVVLSGPKNSGLTTTLHAALRHFDRYMNNVVVFESRGDLEVENVQHIPLDQENGAEAGRRVLAQVRMEPDVVAIDTLYAPEVGRVLAEAAKEKTVVVGLRASDASQALARLADLVGGLETVADVLALVMNQRLVRLLCEECKEAYRPNPEFLRKSNLANRNVDVLYRPPKRVEFEKGKPVICPRCHNVRYVDRAAMFELMPVDEEARAMLARGADVAEVRTHARKQGMRNLQEEGLGLVIEGRTSVDEVLRAIKVAQ